MGRKSTKDNKNVYQLSRENADLTREEASEKMDFVSSDRIEKIESGRSFPHPDEVIAMETCYRDAELCNYYCTHECPIGQKYMPELKVKNLSQITLEMLNSLNLLEKQKDRLIEITVDGKIEEDEKADFAKINSDLNDIANSVRSLQIWLNHVRLNGTED